MLQLPPVAVVMLMVAVPLVMSAADGNPAPLMVNSVPPAKEPAGAEQSVYIPSKCGCNSVGFVSTYVGTSHQTRHPRCSDSTTSQAAAKHADALPAAALPAGAAICFKSIQHYQGEYALGLREPTPGRFRAERALMIPLSGTMTAHPALNHPGVDASSLKMQPSPCCIRSKIAGRW